MAYSTLDDIIGEIPSEVLLQLINDSSSNVSLDLIKAVLAEEDLPEELDDEDLTPAARLAADVLTRALSRASAQVDGYCSNLYDVPFDPAPDFVKALDLDVAIYNLFSRRENVPENRKDRHSNAIKALVAIGKGDVQLGMSGKAAPEQKGQTIAVSSAPEGIFTMTRLRNY